LHAAAHNGKRDVVEILLRNGANINGKTVRNNYLILEKQMVDGEEKRLTGRL
jgi:hypothetical protein